MHVNNNTFVFICFIARDSPVQWRRESKTENWTHNTHKWNPVMLHRSLHCSSSMVTGMTFHNVLTHHKFTVNVSQGAVVLVFPSL